MGGVDYSKRANELMAESALKVPGRTDYWYFGALKDLPSVKAELEQQVEEEK